MKLLMIPGSFDAVDQGARLDVLNLTQRIVKIEKDIKSLLYVVEVLLKTRGA